MQGVSVVIALLATAVAGSVAASTRDVMKSGFVPHAHATAPQTHDRVQQHGTADPAVVDVLTNVKGATAHAYDLKDSTGNQMASLHLLDVNAADTEYYGIYMTNVRTVT
jgi:hypothetical protein